MISPDLSEEEIREFQGKITSLIKEEGGILDESRIPVRKRLAYKIKKQDFAFLASLNFQMSPEGLVNLEKKLKAEDQILRLLIIIKKPTKFFKERVRKFRAQPELVPGEKRVHTEKEKKVELEEIEKKLEEILKE